MVQIAGPEHVCVGIDYFEYQAGVADADTAGAVYDFLLDSGAWTREDYPAPPWYYPEGIDMPEKLWNLTAGLVKRGYSEEDIRGILGRNMMRIFETVWK